MKDIEGYEGRYAITEDGKVWSHPKFKQKGHKGKFLTNSISVWGYVHIVLTKNDKYIRHSIHRLVAKAFIPNPENKPQVNHKNGIKTDNRVQNLEWNTRLENMQHAAKHNLMKHQRGEENGNSKLTLKDVIEMRKLRQAGWKLQKLAARYSISLTTVSDVYNHHYWKHID